MRDSTVIVHNWKTQMFDERKLEFLDHSLNAQFEVARQLLLDLNTLPPSITVERHKEQLIEVMLECLRASTKSISIGYKDFFGDEELSDEPISISYLNLDNEFDEEE
jgi:hypothetical protein